MEQNSNNFAICKYISRQLDFSLFHKEHFNSEIKTINLDYVEYRKNNGELTIVAIIEEKDWNHKINFNSDQIKILKMIAKALNVPAYIVQHTVCRICSHKDMWKFKVTNIFTQETRLMNFNQYLSFIEKLNIPRRAK